MVQQIMKTNIELATELNIPESAVQAVRQDTLEECRRFTVNSSTQDTARSIALMAERNEKGEL
jgi:hypothetical protein